MPRWPAGLHRYAGALPNWGQVNRRAASPPVEWYTGLQSQVPLNDGQGQALVPASGTVTVQIGPSGLGTVWYPAAVTVLTTTGINDTSVANVYAGPAGAPLTPTTLLGTIQTGGAGTLAAAVPPLPTGWLLSVQWTGGHPGDVAAVNVQGSKDARVIG